MPNTFNYYNEAPPTYATQEVLDAFERKDIDEVRRLIAINVAAYLERLKLKQLHSIYQWPKR